MIETDKRYLFCLENVVHRMKKNTRVDYFTLKLNNCFFLQNQCIHAISLLDFFFILSFSRSLLKRQIELVINVESTVKNYVSKVALWSLSDIYEELSFHISLYLPLLFYTRIFYFFYVFATSIPCNDEINFIALSFALIKCPTS